METKGSLSPPPLPFFTASVLLALSAAPGQLPAGEQGGQREKKHHHYDNHPGKEQAGHSGVGVVLHPFLHNQLALRTGLLNGGALCWGDSEKAWKGVEGIWSFCCRSLFH